MKTCSRKWKGADGGLDREEKSFTDKVSFTDTASLHARTKQAFGGTNLFMQKVILEDLCVTDRTNSFCVWVSMRVYVCLCERVCVSAEEEL